MQNRRPVIALVVAILLWFPSLRAFLGGGIDVFPAATRFLVAFGVAYVGVTLLGMVVAGYGEPPVVPVEPPRRRREDYDSDTAFLQAGGPGTVTEAAYSEVIPVVEPLAGEPSLEDSPADV